MEKITYFLFQRSVVLITASLLALPTWHFFHENCLKVFDPSHLAHGIDHIMVNIPPRARKAASYTAVDFFSTSRSTGQKSTGKSFLEMALGIKLGMHLLKSSCFSASNQ